MKAPGALGFAAPLRSPLSFLRPLPRAQPGKSSCTAPGCSVRAGPGHPREHSGLLGPLTVTPRHRQRDPRPQHVARGSPTSRLAGRASARASLNPTLVFPTGSVRQRFHGNRRRSTLQTGPSHPGLPCTSLSPAGSMGAAPGLLLLPLEGPAAGLSPGPELTPPSQSTAGSSLAESVRLDVRWGRAPRCQNASEKTLFLRVRDRLG